jgi:uncharacterized protein (DUF1810 family)
MSAEAVSDPFDLQRFVAAQEAGGTYGRALEEIRAGRKLSHWMWFVFPQLAGLGRSPTARSFAISSPEEARAYLRHPVLGLRLRESARALLELHQGSAEDIFGGLDAMKLRSSMTLFARAEPDEAAFNQVIERYFAGGFDKATDRLLAGGH